jgi:hypothetical protein
MCNNNCKNNECGCKTTSNEIVYQGPSLPCSGIENCDTLTEAIVKINNFLCDPEIVNIFINNIIENPTLLEQFTTIVNDSIECETIWACETTTTTTTIVEECKILKIDSIGNDAVYTAMDCTGKIIGEAIPNEGGVTTVCVFPSTVVLVNAEITLITPCI